MNRRHFLYAALSPLAVAAARAAERERSELPFRQIHLDFHTSELIPDAGADWDPEHFARTLKAARVNSVNVFAKCHHGYAYYDTAIAVKHPSLKPDLLGDMVRVCRREQIAVNYYYSLVWDVLQARQHPEWLALTRAGQPVAEAGSDKWPWLCMNTPYLDRVLAENREILQKYKTDGGWFDILKQIEDGCFCKWCVAERRLLKLSDSAADVFRHNKLVAKRVEQKLADLIHEFQPSGATFFNSRLVIGVRDELPFYSHIEIESLPTGGWGYSHFQQRVRYMRTLGKDCVGMTGRFHKSWGDFGGLKNQAALDYECLNFLANGAKVCVGDQLHPRGKLDPATYSRIGRTYAKVEALEPWCRGARAITDIGVMSVAATNPDMGTQKLPVVDQGFTNMLVELHQQFDVLDLESDFTRYRLLVLPDEIRPSAGLTGKLSRYLEQGGALIVSHRSLLDGGRFALPLGIRYEGPAKFKGEYMLLEPGAFADVEDTPYFLYQHGTSVAGESGTEILAAYGHPYFDRAPGHFSSHKQTPMGRRTREPLITRRGRIAYIANPFFRSYALDGFGVQKKIVGELISGFLPEPALRARGLPSTAQATMLEQPGGRQIVHLLFYPLTRRAPDVDIIEEPGTLARVEVSARTGSRPARVVLVPQGTALPFRYEAPYVRFEVPNVEGHQAIAIG